MSGRLCWLIALAGLVFLPSAKAQEGPLLAVFDIEDKDSTLKRQSLSNLTSYLSTRLAECGYRVIPQDQIRKRLMTEKRDSYKACFDQSCQIELGREMAAQKVLASKILKIADECKLAATLFDLEKAATDLAATESGDCSEASLAKATDLIAAKLCQPVEKMRQE